MADHTDSATAPENTDTVDYEELRRRWKISKAQTNLDMEKSDDDDANAAFLDRHDKIVADIIATIEQCENPETPEEAAELIGFARLLMDDREGVVIDDDTKDPLRMLLDKASRGRWRGPQPASDGTQAMLSAFQGLGGLIRDLAVLARGAADKTIELSADYASLPPEELEVERRNLNDAMSLVTQVQRKAEELQEEFQNAWECKTMTAAPLTPADMRSVGIDIRRAQDLMDCASCVAEFVNISPGCPGIVAALTEAANKLSDVMDKLGITEPERDD